MNFRYLLQLVLGLAAAWLFSSCAAYTPPSRGEKILANIPYKRASDRTLSLDIYQPAQTGPRPLVLWIHGGGWKYGDKGWMLYVRNLTRYGYTVASVEYRLSGRAKYPAAYEDCRDALHFLEQNAGRYNLDRRNFFLTGASAGGHLSALLGLREGSGKINAVFAQYPATDLVGFKNQDAVRGYLPEFLGGSVNAKRALALEGSPTQAVTSHAPPFLFIHGDQDKLVPIEQSRELHRRLREKGIESRVITVPGAGHGFALTDAQVATVAEFFNRHLRK